MIRLFVESVLLIHSSCYYTSGDSYEYFLQKRYVICYVR